MKQLQCLPWRHLLTCQVCQKELTCQRKKGIVYEKIFVWKLYCYFSSFHRLFQAFRHDLLVFVLVTVIPSHRHIYPVLDSYITPPPKEKRLKKKGYFATFLMAKNRQRIILKAPWILAQKFQVKDLLRIKKSVWSNSWRCDDLKNRITVQVSEPGAITMTPQPARPHTTPSIKSEDLIRRDSGNNLKKNNVQMQNNVLG